MGGEPVRQISRRARRRHAVAPAGPLCLGIEGGGTRAVALLAAAPHTLLQRIETGPLNLKLASDPLIRARLRHIRSRLAHRPQHVGLFVAGCRAAADRDRLRRIARQIWPAARIVAGNDLEAGWAAAFGRAPAGILAVSGTGSCVFGRNGARAARAGGWGHLLGDHASAYAVALANLRSLVRHFDRTGRAHPALQRALGHLCLNSPDQLVDWIHHACKDQIAALAPVVMDADPAALVDAARQLADDVAVVAAKLRLAAPDVALTGGLLAHHPKFFKLTARNILRRLPDARVLRPRTGSARGALLLAARPAGAAAASLPQPPAPVPIRGSPIRSLPLTEQRNPRTRDLHRRSVARLVDTMLREEARVVPAIRKQAPAIVRAIRVIVAALRHGGRLFYVGAGTSGRLGVLDAAECPPTFSTDPATVQAILAGGEPALRAAIEAAEDDPAAGAEAVRHRRVNRRDVVVGIAASGRTPFVIGALDEAQRRGAQTFLLCFSPPQVARRHTPLFIATGPEALTGSTRLKAGTATKLVLNMLTTITMIRLGKVIGNLMVDLRPTNDKLRDRACRIVAELRGCDPDTARQRLVRAAWNIKEALQ
jgi:N-acetylmuramic acid 6-phosphate etherase